MDRPSEDVVCLPALLSLVEGWGWREHDVWLVCLAGLVWACGSAGASEQRCDYPTLVAVEPYVDRIVCIYVQESE